MCFFLFVTGSFSLYYKPNSLDLCFEAPSKQARCNFNVEMTYILIFGPTYLTIFFHEYNCKTSINRGLAQQNTFCPYTYRYIWLEALTDTIKSSCRMQRRLWLPIGNEGKLHFMTGMPYTYITDCNCAHWIIFQASKDLVGVDSGSH